MLSSCSKARSLSPIQAAIIARFVTRKIPSPTFFFRTNKLDRTSAFTQCFLFSSKIGIDQPKQAQFLAIVKLRFQDFLLLCACSDKS